MDYKHLRKCIESHLPKELTNKYSRDRGEITIDFCSAESGDDTIVALVRSINPNNEQAWAYEVYVLHEAHMPSLVYWKISRVYSDVTEEMFNKIPL